VLDVILVGVFLNFAFWTDVSSQDVLVSHSLRRARKISDGAVVSV
jgi:hypothetical protein